MLAAPITHYVMLAQSILFRGAGIQAVWVNFLALAAIGGALFSFSLARLRKSLSESR
jgi:ABC-2 type transport system permease protein